MTIREVLYIIDIPFCNIELIDFQDNSNESMFEYLEDPEHFLDNITEILDRRVFCEVGICDIMLWTSYWMADGEIPPMEGCTVKTQDMQCIAI
jgi:hypothetical protein